MNKIILLVGVIAVVFSGCNELRKNSQKQKEKTISEVVVLDEYVLLNSYKHIVSTLCKDGLEYLILTQIRTMAITPHWIEFDGVQKIKNCK